MSTKPGRAGNARTKPGGDNLGASTPRSIFPQGLGQGPLVERGDRVQIKTHDALVPFASWGTVVRSCGLGFVKVQIDGETRVLNCRIYQLQFAKLGRPPLVPA